MQAACAAAAQGNFGGAAAIAAGAIPGRKDTAVAGAAAAAALPGDRQGRSLTPHQLAGNLT
jgi:hypothetical protein